MTENLLVRRRCAEPCTIWRPLCLGSAERWQRSVAERFYRPTMALTSRHRQGGSVERPSCSRLKNDAESEDRWLLVQTNGSVTDCGFEEILIEMHEG